MPTKLKQERFKKRLKERKSLTKLIKEAKKQVVEDKA